VKERRASIPARIADTIAGGVRRRQQEREPRAVIYDSSGAPRVVPAGSDDQRELIEIAERVVEAAMDGAAIESSSSEGDAPAAEAPEG